MILRKKNQTKQKTTNKQQKALLSFSIFRLLGSMTLAGLVLLLFLSSSTRWSHKI